MVRLALVRFQRHSLRGPTTSPVVRTDLVGLLHGRTVRARVEAAEPIFAGPGTTGDTLVVQLGGDPVSREVELRAEWCAAAPPDDALTATTDVAGTRVWTVLASGSGPANPHTGDHGLTFTRQASGSTASSSPSGTTSRRRAPSPRRPRVARQSPADLRRGAPR